MIKTMHENVALKPLVFEHDKGTRSETVKGFVGSDKLMKTVVATVVVFNSKSFKTGQKVYLRADAYNLPFVNQVMSINGKEFILVPEGIIIAIESPNHDDICDEQETDNA